MPDEQIDVQATQTEVATQPETGEITVAPTSSEEAQGEDNGGDGTKQPAKAPEEASITDDGKEPDTRSRLSKQDFIIGRQRAKLAKQQTAQATEDDTANDVAIEDEDMITRVIARQLAPIIDKSLAADDDKEVSDFLSENPDFKSFEAKARRYMAHPSRRSLPIKSIFYEVAGDHLLKMGAERLKQANAKASESQTGGGSNRSDEGTTNDWNSTPEEFAAEQERVRRGNR